MNNDQLQELARRGAVIRYRELMAELWAIASTFPNVVDGYLARVARNLDRQAGDRKPARKRARRTMTAAERKAVSRRMRAYWKKRRAEKSART